METLIIRWFWAHLGDVQVNREALSGYDELVTEEDIYALERSRRGPRRPSWKLLNPPRKKSGEQANPIVVLLGSWYRAQQDPIKWLVS